MKERWIGFLLTTLTLAFIALSTGGPLFGMIAVLMATMFVLSLLSAVWTLHSARIMLNAKSMSVNRGQNVPITITLWHSCPFPVAAMYLSLSLPEDQTAVDELSVSPRPFRHTDIAYQLSCPHRGIYTIGVNTIWVSDVFSLFTFRRYIGDRSFTLTVKPNIADILPLKLQSGENGPESMAHMTEDLASPSSVRAYVPGDPLKKIHWKLSMRRRELTVRQYEETARPDTLILMDCSAVNATREMALDVEDALCEVAAAVIKTQLTAGYPVRMPLYAKAQDEQSAQSLIELQRFVTALTRLEFNSQFSYEAVLELEMRRMTRTGGVVLITQRINTQIADMALRMRNNGLKVAVYWISDSQRQDALTLLTRLSTQSIQTHRVSPLVNWKERKLA